MDNRNAEAAKVAAVRDLDAAISSITKAYGDGSIMHWVQPGRMMLPSPYAFVMLEMAASKSRWRTAATLAASAFRLSTAGFSKVFLGHN